MVVELFGTNRMCPEEFEKVIFGVVAKLECAIGTVCRVTKVVLSEMAGEGHDTIRNAIGAKETGYQHREDRIELL
jgi:hypothetical protein